MSQLFPMTTVGLGQFFGSSTLRNDDSLQPPDYRQTFPMSSIGLDRFSDVTWPRSSFPGQLLTNYLLEATHQLWEYNLEIPTGVHVRKKVSGVVYNVSNTPVSGATVLLFNTATGLQVDSQTSASDGTFNCTDPNAVNCFAVADIAGSPETAGTTIQELTGV